LLDEMDDGIADSHAAVRAGVLVACVFNAVVLAWDFVASEVLWSTANIAFNLAIPRPHLFVIASAPFQRLPFLTRR
jgi:hypothetical protein